jgi:hypothetical protein
LGLIIGATPGFDAGRIPSSNPGSS